VPAAAVIPAPRAYINVVAVKKPVVGFENRACGRPGPSLIDVKGFQGWMMVNGGSNLVRCRHSSFGPLMSMNRGGFARGSRSRIGTVLRHAGLSTGSFDVVFGGLLSWEAH